MRPVRVLWLTDSLAPGGAESLAVTFARGLDRERVDLRVAFLKPLDGNPFEEGLREIGVSLTDLAARNLRDVASFRRLLSLVREEAIDVIHAHLAYASIWGCLAGRLAGVPAITTFHVAPPPDPSWSREGLRRILRVRLTNALGQRAIAVSRAVAELWIETGLDPARVTVVHNGVPVGPAGSGERPDRTRSALRSALGVSGDPALIATVSALREGKGLEDLLVAMDLRRRAGREGILAIAGEGPLRPGLEERIRAAGLTDRVRLLGFRRDVPALLGAADLFVLPSRWDAFPTAVLEAMASGLPVVATRTGGVPEMIDDGVTGLLVPPGDPGALAGAVDRVLGDRGLARRLGTTARAAARDRFSLEVWRERLYRLYEEAARAPGKEAA